MQANPFQSIFLNSFDTYKVFGNLTIHENAPTGAPKTTWQILNHLIAWQKYQLEMLKGDTPAALDEHATWIAQKQPENHAQLKDAVSLFYNLIDDIKLEITSFDSDDVNLTEKLTIVQNLSLHLAFHVGEVVLMRRITGNYPMPQEMSAFLAE
nr:hypothetical protein [uncultured Mucilaginibacter sp.]